MLTIYIIFVIIFFILGWITASGNKTQTIRLVDVFIYGPILIYSGIVIENAFLKIMLLFIGSTTISYNLRNYLYH